LHDPHKPCISRLSPQTQTQTQRQTQVEARTHAVAVVVVDVVQKIVNVENLLVGNLSEKLRADTE